MEEQPVIEQENDVEEDAAATYTKDEKKKDNVTFDAELFSSLIQKELIMYNFSWDPLLQALQTLGTSMARQQHEQKNNNDSIDDMHDQMAALRDQLLHAESEKKDMAESLSKVQEQLATMQSQLEKLQMQQHEQEQWNSAMSAKTESNLHMERSTTPHPATPEEPFVTAKELADAKKTLNRELTRNLSAVFGVDIPDNAESLADDGNGGTRVISYKAPGVPYASDAVVKDEIAKLHELQNALNATLEGHNEKLDILERAVGKLDNVSSQLASRLDDEAATVAAHSDQLRNKSSIPSAREPDPSTTIELQKDLNDLKAVQDGHEQILQDHTEALEQCKRDMKALLDQLDDLDVRQQTQASLFVPTTASSGHVEEQNGNNESSDQASASKRRVSDASALPQLDLSLVFTKIADLRRSTDASITALQQNLKDISSANQKQQSQLDTLRNGQIFNELKQIDMIETRLAMQKELLNHNQTYQDRIKPQLAEWKKALTLNEDKLMQGNCEEEILQELQELQRHYHRMILSITPLINSPSAIAESLRTLAEETKHLQNGIQAGVLPSRMVENGQESHGRKNSREDEYSRKLRYLDEEIDATLQVNAVTEKKNDPLIKGLDTMREKLETLWQLWHKNYNQRRRGSILPGISDAQQHVATGQHGASTDSEGIREVELRLMGAIRRLGTVEEDVERLNHAAALHSSEIQQAGRSGEVNSKDNNNRSNADDLAILRKEMYDEIAKMSALLADLRTGSTSGLSTSLVPVGQSTNLHHSVTQGDLVNELYSQMKNKGGKELDGRFLELTDDSQKLLYDNFVKEVTKKVTQAVINADKAGGRVSALNTSSGMGGGGAGIGPGNINYRLMMENFTQKVEDRLQDAQDMTAEELARIKKELADQLKLRIDIALRELRGELMIFPTNDNGESTAMGTKPVMCVACSRPVPVSNVIREAGSLPPAEIYTEPSNPAFQNDYEYDRHEDEFVYRAGFRMPANDRKPMTLPFLVNNLRNKMVLNKPEGKRKRPPRQGHTVNRVDHIVREAMELDRASRSRTQDTHGQ